MFGNIKKRIEIKVLKASKFLYQDILLRNSKAKTIIMIVGCQRSGTTMLSGIFEKDWKIKNFSEKSILSSSDPKRLRLDPLPEVLKKMHRTNAPVVALKPLVESQNTVKLLDYFKNSKAIWVFRNYKDVAASNLKKFGRNNGMNNLRPLIENKPGNWRSDKVSEKTRAVVNQFFSEDMVQEDAAALFWYCRNILFFEQDLQSNKRVLLCKYEDLVTHPKTIVKEIYSFSAVHDLPEKIISGIHAGSISKGKNVKLSPEIDHLCESLYNKINAVYTEKTKLNN
ncbi:MAG: hypothetical protein Mars2KO_09990 [Maribacter sp.]